MVARINTGKSISKALNYNEKKVQQNEAECLHAQNFLKDADQLTFYEKIKHFNRLTSLNQRTVTNTLHVSLNFDPSEKLSNEKLKDIALEYMDRIGFGEQPFIVYRHYDTGHPHIHIVSTNIQPDGRRISVHNLGKKQSENARKHIEIKYGLVQAESRKHANTTNLKSTPLAKLNSDKRRVKSAISNVLVQVIFQYKYCSLPELNAVLGLYNIMADRCDKNSETYKRKGLYYRVLDDKGNKTGTPIKASVFYMKPTLQLLERKFEENIQLRQKYSKLLKVAIDFALMHENRSGIEYLVSELQKEGIDLVLRRGKENRIYGITYVDHRTKCVFNGSDLGKSYSAFQIIERCRHPRDENHSNKPEHGSYEKKTLSHEHDQSAQTSLPFFSLMDEITNPEINKEGIPYLLRKRKKKLRRKINQ